MSAMYVVMMKELVDLARDRRTVMISLLMGPFLIAGLIMGMGALMQKKMVTQMEKTLELPVIGAEHAPNLIAWLSEHNIEVKPAPADPETAIAQQDEDVILRITISMLARKPVLSACLFMRAVLPRCRSVSRMRPRGCPRRLARAIRQACLPR